VTLSDFDYPVNDTLAYCSQRLLLNNLAFIGDLIWFWLSC